MFDVLREDRRWLVPQYTTLTRQLFLKYLQLQSAK